MIKSTFQRVLFSLLCCTISSAFAGGFQLWEQDASGIGDNHAGSGAEALNAGIEYYNPAGMTLFKHFTASLGGAYIPLEMKFVGNVGSSSPPISTTASTDTNNYVPNLHVVVPINPRVAMGFGVTVPFGLMTEYPISNPISSAATKTQLETVNLNPNLSVALNKFFSIAGGFDALYGKAIYNSANNLIRSNGQPNRYENQLSAWAYGYNAGFLINFPKNLRLGLSYRSAIKLEGRGNSYDSQTNVTLDTLNATFHLPPTWNLSLYKEINQRFSVLFSAYYTQWRVFDDLVLHNVAVMNQVITLGVHENYRNTLALALGLHVRVNKSLMFKFGVGHDQTPTQNGMRDVRLPDSDRYSLAMGISWRIVKAIKLDVGWMHFFVDAAKVDNTNSTFTTATSPMAAAIAQIIANQSRTVGTSYANVNVVGVQLQVSL